MNRTDRSAIASLTRRSILAGIAMSALPARLSAAADQEVRLFAGGYNAKGGRGVLPLGYRPSDDTWRGGKPVATAPDASFGVHGTRVGLQYLVQEGAEGHVSAFRVSGDRWTRVAHVSALGADPCHLALDGTQTALAVANYGSGSVTLFRLDPRTGLPRDGGTLRVHRGSGPVRERQASAHAHWVGFTPDNRWLRAVDLGADAIFAYRFDAASGRIGEAEVAYRGEPGLGPRHLALHPRLPRAYLLNELGNSITILRSGVGATLQAITTLSTLPAGFTGTSSAAELVLNAAGTRLYASNRGHDSIAVFAVARDGGLTLLQHIGCGGRSPRFIRLLDGASRLLVANQDSGTIATFRVGRNGRLAQQGAGIAAPGVAYIG